MSLIFNSSTTSQIFFPGSWSVSETSDSLKCFSPVNYSGFLSTLKWFFFFKFGVHKEMLQIIHDTTNIGTLKGIFIAISHQIHQQHIHKHTYSVINNYMSYYIYYITFLSQKICICEKTIQYILYIIQWIKKKVNQGMQSWAGTATGCTLQMN